MCVLIKSQDAISVFETQAMYIAIQSDSINGDQLILLTPENALIVAKELVSLAEMIIRREAAFQQEELEQ